MQFPERTKSVCDNYEHKIAFLFHIFRVCVCVRLCIKLEPYNSKCGDSVQELFKDPICTHLFSQATLSAEPYSTMFLSISGTLPLIAQAGV